MQLFPMHLTPARLGGWVFRGIGDMPKVITPEENVIAEIRKLIRTKSGKQSTLTGAPNDILWSLYQAIRQGSSLMECAELLQSKGFLKHSSLDSARKSVAKFKARISPLLTAPPKRADLPSARKTIATNDLERISRLTELYADVLESELEAAQAGTPLNPNLSKHASGLSQLLRAKMLLERAPKKKEPEGLAPAESDKFKGLFGKMQKGAMLDLTRRFINEVESACIELEECEDGTLRLADGEQRH
jgi:hypothetical protein